MRWPARDGDLVWPGRGGRGKPRPYNDPDGAETNVKREKI